MKAHIFIQDFIEHFIYINEAFLELRDVVADFGFGDEDFVGDFFVALGEDKVGVFFEFFVEFFNDLGLVEVGSLWFIKDSGFLTFLYKHSPQVIKPVSNNLTMGQMHKFLLDIFFPFRRLRSNSMWLGKNNRTELNQELLKPQIIQLLGLPLIQQLDIDISYQILHLTIRSQEIQLILF